MQITFQDDEFKKIGRSYKGADRIVHEETVLSMERSVTQIEAEAKRRVPTDTHNLQRSITHEVEDAGKDVVGRAGTNVEYAEPVEMGRRAGAPPPPSDALLGWMGRKGIDPTLAFVIAQSIGRRGIRPRPYLKPGYDVARLKISREMGQVRMKRIMARVGKTRV